MPPKEADDYSDDVALPMSEFEPSDGCPICQAMKKADQKGRSLSASELREAFKETDGLKF